MFTSTDAPRVDHFAHEDSAITNFTRMGYFENNFHRWFNKLVATYDGQCHALYHVRRVLHTTIYSFLSTLTDTMYVVVLKPIDVRREQGFLNLFELRLADNCFNSFQTFLPY